MKRILAELDRFWVASAPILAWLGLIPPRPGPPGNRPLGACPFSRRRRAGSLSQGLRGAKHLPANGRFYPYRGQLAL